MKQQTLDFRLRIELQKRSGDDHDRRDERTQAPSKLAKLSAEARVSSVDPKFRRW